VTAILTVLGVLIFGLAGAIVLVLMFGNEDTDVPEAAEAPDPVDAHHDEYERAKYFTGEGCALPGVAPPRPAVVAGDDLRMSILMGQIERACFEYREGVDICADAVREPSPEVKR
jgi:hypothetical protein